MSEIQFLYPPTPTDVPSQITQPSAIFRKVVSSTVGSILLFFIVYLLLFLLSVAFAIGGVCGGIALMVNAPGMITLLIGVGLIGLGIMVFVFLIKFLFAVSRFDRSGSIEITNEQQPMLYAFIEQLTKDTQTSLPKRVYLSPDVNACVFYDSSFWSMFFPVRKNLQIGLGLVNSVNISEFKAVMAHEFGHFSQRSMKLGSFVYNVNRIIYNMLFENTSYSRFLQGWASVGSIFALFASITAKIANGIQWILRRMYGFINRNYMRLSREMEFHADAVAASVSGSNSLVSALRRIELANAGYNITLQKCEDLFKQKKVSHNIYHNQRVVLKQLAEEFKLEMRHELPVVSNEFIVSNNLSRVNFKDQWASHPSTEDREKHLNDLGVESEIMEQSAWVLFNNADQLQAQLTGKVYEKAINGQQVTTIDGREFEEKFYGDVNRFLLPEEYNGFYDERKITILETKQLSSAGGNITMMFKDIFSRQHAGLHKKIKALANDIELLRAIASKKIDSKSFDFDGIKHKQKDAETITIQLETEQKEEEKRLEELDRLAILFFLAKAKRAGGDKEEGLRIMYIKYFEQRQKADEFLAQMNKMLQSLAPIYSGQSIPVSQIRVMIDELKNEHELKLKGWLKGWMDLGVFDGDKDTREQVEKFIGSNYAYFEGKIFFDNELQALDSVCHESWACVNYFLFYGFKMILQKQLDYIRPNEINS